MEIGSQECGGPGESFDGLRMCLRSHSRDCAGQTPGPHCACVQLPGSSLHKNYAKNVDSTHVCVCSLFYGVTWVFGANVTSKSHMGEMRDSDWSRPNLLRSDWLLLSVAPITTVSCKKLSNQKPT